ncbi:MAG TPA: S8 family serine peptidase [Hyphomicrobiales bacterium]|nr:S8 family serine peptidase [Hyphomicrobiales bacterium]
MTIRPDIVDDSELDAAAHAAVPTGLLGTMPFGNAGWSPAASFGWTGTPIDAGVAGAAGSPGAALVAGFHNVDKALRADLARAHFHVDGTGLKIGVISDSFNQGGGMKADIASGELPAAGKVHVLKDDGSGGSTDEGRAMAEVIHSIAPGAQIYFYTSGGEGPAGGGKAVAALQKAGCDIICDDINFFGNTSGGGISEPFYQMGDPFSAAIDAAVKAGTTYFTMAYNADNSYYEGTFNPFLVQLRSQNGQIQNFIAENFGTSSAPTPYESLTIPTDKSVSINLQWDQPFASFGGGAGSANSLGWILYDQNGNVVHWSMIDVTGKDPVQSFNFNTNGATSTQYYLSIVEDSANQLAPTPGLFKVLISDDNAQPVVFNDPNAGIGSGTIIGHARDPSAITVGAVNFADTPAFKGTVKPEPFSGTGPGLFLFDANGNRLATPVTPNKVQIASVDGMSTAVPGFDPFLGTSAATPAAAAVGALALQARPTLNPLDVAHLLEDSATPFAATTVAGAGLIRADFAVSYAETLHIAENKVQPIVSGTHLNDVFVGGAGTHTIDGGGGSDTLDYSAAKKAVTVDFAHGTAKGFGGTDSFHGIAAVIGGHAGDHLAGAAGAQTLSGAGGADRIAGGSGNDVLNGGLGNDILDGGAGKDRLSGGGGHDSFLFDSAVGKANADTITDFSVADDTIRLENAVFKALHVGTLPKADFVIGHAAADRNDYIVYQPHSGALLYDSDGKGGKAAVEFAVLDHDLHLTAADFLVV